jgi:predicted TIM-barrel fold metal-dependent hydrolase
MDSAGVSRAVLVPPTWAGDGNEVALAAARRNPSRFAVMGKLDPLDPLARGSVAAWPAQDGMLGLRLVMFTRAQKRALAEGQFEWLWGAATSARVPLMIYPPGLLADIGRIALAHPELRIVIDHCGAPVKRGTATLRAAVVELVGLARYPNVGVKISNLTFFSESAYPFRDVQDIMLSVIDAFGPRRVFWGSDLTRLDCTYREAVTMMTEDFPALRGSALELVMGEALSDWLKWRS